MVKLFLKILSLIVIWQHPKMPGQYRWFVRCGYISRINQLKYLIKDFIFKDRYRIVEYNGEFSPELKFVLPFAYWHHKNGTLLKTVSSADSAPFYFFSENHEERFNQRYWNNFNYDFTIPNVEDHNVNYSYQKWLQVPLKKHYQNSDIIFERPILLISNKYNKEWGGEPINFLDLDTLKLLFNMFSEDYQIIYNRPKSSQITEDNSEIQDLKDRTFIKKHFPHVIDLSELYDNYSQEISFNTFQLKVYANTYSFISVQGGNATLASYFGGTNLIYAQKGHEIFFEEYKTIYPKLSGAKIVAVDNYQDLITNAKNEFLKR